MMLTRTRSPLPCLLCFALASTSAFAQTSLPAGATLAQQLVTADAAHAPALIDALPLDQVPAFVAKLDPDALPADARETILDHVHALVRRARQARKIAYEAQDREWDLRTGLAVYRASAKETDPWNALALDALGTNASLPLAESAVKFKAAVDAGCPDPLVRYFNIRRALQMNAIAPAKALAEYRALIGDFDKSAYSPVRRFQLQIQILRLAADKRTAFSGSADIMAQAWAGATALLPKLAQEHAGPLLFDEAFDLLIRTGVKLQHSLKADYDLLNEHLREVLPNSAFPDFFTVEFYTNWAWEARGSGWANSVTENGWKLFGERLVLAEKAATEGYQRDPLDGRCPAEMITVCMGRSYDRSVMEKWFTRAMLANPDNYDACVYKFNFLLPKWGGSEEQVVAFGRECLKQGTVASRIPAILLDVHYSLAHDSDDPDTYYQRPAVWSDIKSVYAVLLGDPTREKQDRESWLYDRARYLKYATECHQWQAFLDLSQEYGDNFDMAAFGSKAVYGFLKKKAEREVAKQPL